VNRIRIICLGNRHASDDGAALRAVDALNTGDVIPAGRPGTGLLDLLDDAAAVVIVDVTRSGVAPGTIHCLSFDQLGRAAVAEPTVSSHGFGVAHTLALRKVLGLPTPPGVFVGIEGVCFDPGETLSPAVTASLPALATAIREAVSLLARAHVCGGAQDVAHDDLGGDRGTLTPG